MSLFFYTLFGILGAWAALVLLLALLLHHGILRRDTLYQQELEAVRRLRRERGNA